jgi:UDP-N-acetylglucosamine 2-epimerase (non-hydrolysing)
LLLKVLSVFGTRPEAVKMCPLVLKLQKTPGIHSLVCVTAQHRAMLDQVLDIFGVVPDYDLNLMTDRQTLTSLSIRVLEKLEPVFKSAKPDLVLVHGDTSTSLMAALAAFYQQIPVGHVEAGLRTGDIYAPYPEEMNRQMIGRIAVLHFAPTILNERNLELDHVHGAVHITGNTGIDALATTVHPGYRFKDPALRAVDFAGKRVVLMTAHRRENLGEPLANICRAVRRLAETFPDVLFLYPVHKNPTVRDPVYAMLGDVSGVCLTDPVDVQDMHNAMQRAYLVLTDSGGLQEEAPSLGKPVLVLRAETERPEAVEAGTAKVIGTEEEHIVAAVTTLLRDPAVYASMASAVNPYGDGQACERIADILLRWRQALR